MTEFDHLPEIDRPDMVESELIEQMRAAFMSRPRSLQSTIGPSGAGDPCTRAVIYQLAGRREPPDARGGVNLKAEVGTMIHAGMEQIFRESPLTGRYLTEVKLNIGRYAGRDLTGTCDLFDVLAGGVIDHKSKGASMMLHHRRHGMGEQYRVQCQLYGLGWHRLGMKVNWVGCLFIPRDGEFRDVFLKAEPFDGNVGLAALARLDTLARLVDALGADGAAVQYPPCGDQWCRWCPSPRRYIPDGEQKANPFAQPKEK